MLDRYPVPDDLVELLATPEPGYLAVQRQQLDCAPGETIQGFHTPGFVERVDMPAELAYAYVMVTKIDESYNLARGGVPCYTVDLSDWIVLTRLPDEPSPRGGHAMAVFRFNAGGVAYRLSYDPGTASMFAALAIDAEPA